MNPRVAFMIFIFCLLFVATTIILPFHNMFDFEVSETKQNLELQALLDNIITLTNNGNGKHITLEYIIESLKLHMGDTNNDVQNYSKGDNLKAFNQPSIIYERTRRRITTEINEMWTFVRGQFGNLTSQLVDDAVRRQARDAMNLLAEYKSAILNNLQKLSEVDGYQEWRAQEHEDLSNLIQNRLRNLQNPKNCTTAKKILCDFGKTFGWANKLHHVSLCMIMAYGSGRTLIFNWTDGWNFKKTQWTTFFNPLSENCTTVEGHSIVNWPGTDESQVLKVVPYMEDGLPDYWPPAIPQDISERLIRFHGNPFVWLLGQFFKYILRPQPYLEKLIGESALKLGFQKPIVGIHVRRTDKIKEAKYHDLAEYMEHVQYFYHSLELRQTNVTRRVYLATDDPSILSEAKDRFPDYQFICDPRLAETAAVGKRSSSDALLGIILDIYFLSRTDYTVCTYSSNICRLVYEIMQSLVPDASNAVKSIDVDYFFYDQQPRLQEILYSHHPVHLYELAINPGDVIRLKPNVNNNGFYNGLHLLNNQSGMYPSFKAADKIYLADFTNYSAIVEP